MTAWRSQRRMGTFGNTAIYQLSQCRKGPGRPGSQISHTDQTGCSAFNLISYLSGFMAEHGAFSWIWLFLPLHGSLGNNMRGSGVRTQGSGSRGWAGDDSLTQVCSGSTGCGRMSGLLHEQLPMGQLGVVVTGIAWCFMGSSPCVTFH